MAASLIKINKLKYEKIIRLLVKRISEEKKEKLYHYEFNRYALIDAFGSKKALKILNTNKFTYGKVANWSILRVICRFNENKNKFHIFFRTITSKNFISNKFWYTGSKRFI